MYPPNLPSCLGSWDPRSPKLLGMVGGSSLTTILQDIQASDDDDSQCTCVGSSHAKLVDL